MFCENLKRLRSDRGLSQQAIASLLGITQQAYANYESGKREPDHENLLRLSEIYSVSVDQLLSAPIPDDTAAPSPLAKALGARLRDIRRQRRITMKQLGESIGLAESTISQYETGKRQMDYETLQAVCRHLNISSDYLLGLTDLL